MGIKKRKKKEKKEKKKKRKTYYRKHDSSKERYKESMAYNVTTADSYTRSLERVSCRHGKKATSLSDNLNKSVRRQKRVKTEACNNRCCPPVMSASIQSKKKTKTWL